MGNNLIKKLLVTFARRGPIDSAELESLGISIALAHYYVQEGWLTKLGRGVFIFSGDDLRLEDCLAFLCRRTPGLHVGGKTALGLFGIAHYVPAREEISLWAPKNYRVPDWFKTRFACRLTLRNLFQDSLPPGQGIESLPDAKVEYPVSAPERALLEMLSEVGVHQGVEEARSIMEGLPSPRTALFVGLLKACRQVKTVRLCLNWATELRLPWSEAVKDVEPANKNRSRWITRLKDGTTLSLK